MLGADGSLLTGVEPARGGILQEYHFVMVDDRHVIYPFGEDRRITLLPETSSPSPVARAFLSWAHAAGGIAHSTYLHASTNAYADLSCAIGADGSIAVWRTIGAVQFEASAPGTVSLSATSVEEIYCLETPDGLSVAIAGVDRADNRGPWVRIYDASGVQTAELPTILDDIRYGMRGSYAGHAMLADMTPPRALDDTAWTWIATRISYADGGWQIERAGFPVMRADDILIAPDADASEGLVSVPWPHGETSIPYAPRAFVTRPPSFSGPYAISPSGRLILWNHQSSIQVTPAPQSSIASSA